MEYLKKKIPQILTCTRKPHASPGLPASAMFPSEKQDNGMYPFPAGKG